MENYKTKSAIYFACFIMSASICYFVESKHNDQSNEAQTELVKSTIDNNQLAAR